MAGILDYEPDRWERAYDEACAKIRARYPDDNNITDDQFWSMYHEMMEAYRTCMPQTTEEWLEHFGDMPCLHCERYVGMSRCGEVTCKDITVYIPRGMLAEKHTTHVLRRGPAHWITSPTGKRLASCEDYKKAKGQTRLAL